jgi:UDP-2,3-diacylglucosamine pyrophosphatase LpxH
MDGIVCGHIHRPEMLDLDGVLYCNDGDWVDSCSALVEQRNGELELWSWTDVNASVPELHRAPTPVRAA